MLSLKNSSFYIKSSANVSIYKTDKHKTDKCPTLMLNAKEVNMKSVSKICKTNDNNASHNKKFYKIHKAQFLN